MEALTKVCEQPRHWRRSEISRHVPLAKEDNSTRNPHNMLSIAMSKAYLRADLEDDVLCGLAQGDKDAGLVADI